MKKAKHVHFIGIKGVGMTPLAILTTEAKIKVTGSDTEEKFITDEALEKAGISWKVGFSAENIEGNPDLVVVTGAHDGLDNPEAQAAIKRGFKTVMQGEAVGVFMDGKILGRENLTGISIAGSHGKTTTTAIIAMTLLNNNLDPSFIVGCGGISNSFLPGHLGKGKYIVAEADEYATCPGADKTPKFLWQNPKIAIITNIEYDHPDVFDNLAEVKDAFFKFMSKVPRNGTLVVGQDANIRSLMPKISAPSITFGEGPQNDWQLTKYVKEDGKNKFIVKRKSVDYGIFELPIPGRFNALNALAAIVIGTELGFSYEKIRRALSQFQGTKRRFEFIGEVNSIKLYDDYAHHPTEITSTLTAARNLFSGKKITCIFQPHTYSRTKILLSDFARSFSGADEVIVVDIYSSSREKDDFGINSKILTQEIAKYHSHVKYLGTMGKVIDYLKKTATGRDVIFTMGAGDIFLWHKEILGVLNKGAH